MSSPQLRYSPVSGVTESQSASTSINSDQHWQENGISRPESAVSQESREADTEEIISETKSDKLRKILINFLTEMEVPLTASLIKWISDIPLSNGSRKTTSRKRRRKKRENERNVAVLSPSPQPSEISRASKKDTYM